MLKIGGLHTCFVVCLSRNVNTLIPHQHHTYCGFCPSYKNAGVGSLHVLLLNTCPVSALHKASGVHGHTLGARNCAGVLAVGAAHASRPLGCSNKGSTKSQGRHRGASLLGCILMSPEWVVVVVLVAYCVLYRQAASWSHVHTHGHTHVHTMYTPCTPPPPPTHQ